MPGYHASCNPDSHLLVQTFKFEISKVLESINWWRRNVRPSAYYMPDVWWDDDLAISAERYAASCPIVYADDYTKDIGNTSVGQTICWSKKENMSWRDCVDSWAKESHFWRYGEGPTSSDVSVANYLQLINQGIESFRPNFNFIF